jgi:hypothetical protein
MAQEWPVPCEFKTVVENFGEGLERVRSIFGDETKDGWT